MAVASSSGKPRPLLAVALALCLCLYITDAALMLSELSAPRGDSAGDSAECLALPAEAFGEWRGEGIMADGRLEPYDGDVRLLLDADGAHLSSAGAYAGLAWDAEHRSESACFGGIKVELVEFHSDERGQRLFIGNKKTSLRLCAFLMLTAHRLRRSSKG